MNVRTRIVAGTIGLVLMCALFVDGWFAVAALSVAVGHKAKTLCSGVFVSKLNEAAVLADLQADDLAILRHISASTDSDGRSVKASLLGIVTRHAQYRDGLGCTLALSDLDPPTLEDGVDPVDQLLRRDWQFDQRVSLILPQRIRKRRIRSLFRQQGVDEQALPGVLDHQRRISDLPNADTRAAALLNRKGSGFN